MKDFFPHELTYFLIQYQIDLSSECIMSEFYSTYPFSSKLQY